MYNFARTNPDEKSKVLPQVRLTFLMQILDDSIMQLSKIFLIVCVFKEDHSQRIMDGTTTTTASVPTSIDVVTVEPNDNETDVESAFSSTTRVSIFQ